MGLGRLAPSSPSHVPSPAPWPRPYLTPCLRCPELANADPGTLSPADPSCAESPPQAGQQGPGRSLLERRQSFFQMLVFWIFQIFSGQGLQGDPRAGSAVLSWQDVCPSPWCSPACTPQPWFPPWAWACGGLKDALGHLMGRRAPAGALRLSPVGSRSCPTPVLVWVFPGSSLCLLAAGEKWPWGQQLRLAFRWFCVCTDNERSFGAKAV